MPGHDAPSALDRPAADPVRHRLAVLQDDEYHERWAVTTKPSDLDA